MIEKETGDWELLGRSQQYVGYVFPKISIVIPSYNNSQTIALTLEQLLIQDYPDFQVIIVDASSTDRTLETIKFFYDERLQIATIPIYNRYEMVNKGLSLANGEYVNILFPGDFYVNNYILRDMMALAIDHNRPHLVYGASMIRGSGKDVKMLYRPLTLELLKAGQQPTSLQGCWFRIDTFKIIGKFNPRFRSRGGFDLLCRFLLNNLTFESTKKVVTDYDLRSVNTAMVFNHMIDTWLALYTHFGFMAALRWLIIQKDYMRYLKLWKRKIKAAFIEGGD
jgi:glycosyltransferase involved in cell wall biosynthesis